MIVSLDYVQSRARLDCDLLVLDIPVSCNKQAYVSHHGRQLIVIRTWQIREQIERGIVPTDSK
jgi:hypothetical protein